MTRLDPDSDATEAALARKRERRLGLLVALVALGVVGSSLHLVIEASRLPWADQWHFLFPERYLAHPFRQHNEHRLAFPSLVFAIDAWLFHGTNVFDRLVVVAFGFAHALLLARLGTGGEVRTPRFALAFAACATAMLSALAWHDLVWGFAVQLVAVFFFASCAIACVTALAPSIASSFLASASVVLACFSMGNGVLVGPYVLLVAALVRRPKRELATLAAVTVATVGFYFWDYHSPDPNTSLASSIGKPFAVVAYALRVLGGPLVRPFGAWRPIPGLIAGAVGAAAWLVLSASWIRAARPGARVPEAASAALPAIAGFTALSAFAMALGRVSFPALHAFSPRYAVVGLVFASALLLEVYRRAEGLEARTKAARGLVAFVLLLAVEQPFAFRSGLRHVRETRDAETAFLAEANDAAALGVINFTHEVTLEELPALRARRWSIFHDPWAGWLGDPLGRHLAPLERASCGGHVEPPIGVAAFGEPAYRITGHVPSRIDGARVERLLVVDESQRIVGYAQVAPGFGSLRAFSGHVGGRARPSARVSVHAMVGEDRSCLVGSAVPLPEPGPSLALASSLGAAIPMRVRESRGFASPGVPVGEPGPGAAGETLGDYGAPEDARLVWHGCADAGVRSIGLPVQVSRQASVVTLRVRSDAGPVLFELADPREFRRWGIVRLALPGAEGGRCLSVEIEQHDSDPHAFVAVASPHVMR